MKGKRYLAISISAAALLTLCVMLAACSNSTPSATSTARATPTPASSGQGTATSSPPAPTGSPTVAVATNPSLGKILVDAQGMTLYRSDKDSSGTSNCTGTCAQVWPPLAAGAGAPQGGAWLGQLSTRRSICVAPDSMAPRGGCLVSQNEFERPRPVISTGLGGRL